MDPFEWFGVVVFSPFPPSFVLCSFFPFGLFVHVFQGASCLRDQRPVSGPLVPPCRCCLAAEVRASTCSHPFSLPVCFTFNFSVMLGVPIDSAFGWLSGCLLKCVLISFCWFCPRQYLFVLMHLHLPMEIAVRSVLFRVPLASSSGRLLLSIAFLFGVVVSIRSAFPVRKFILGSQTQRGFTGRGNSPLHMVDRGPI